MARMKGSRGIRGRRILLATMCLMGGAAMLMASSLTDPDIHVPPNYYTMQPPAVGGSYVDPVFGTTIKRVTDAAQLSGSVGLVPVYSQSSMLNLNDTYMSLVSTVNGSRHLYDGNGTYIRWLNEVDAEPRWSRLNPNYLYFRTSTQIRRLNVATGQVTNIATFPNSISLGNGTGDVSDNERIVVLRANRYISVWDLANGVQVSSQELDTFQSPINGSGIDYVTISKGGDSFVIGYNSSGLGRGRGIEQFDVNGNFVVQLWNHASHAAMGRDVNGEQVYFIANSTSGINCDNGILKIRLDGSAATSCLMTLDWSIDKHLSAHGNDGWVYLSTYQVQATPVAAVYPGDTFNLTKWHPYTNEIFRVKADGTVVERLAHHRSRIAEYWTQPHASISISGNKLVYGSDFMLNGQAHYADTYMIDIGSSPQGGYYVLDGFGGMHAAGGAPVLPPATPYWGFDVASDLELASTGYYVLDRFGGVHAGGGAPTLSPVTPYWGWNVAGDLELAPVGHYVLDRFGGVHAGGGAPALLPMTPYWGFDVASDLELASTGYYVLDRFGGVHPGGGASELLPATPYWGFDVAADLELASAGYYVLDRFGGVHSGGGAPELFPVAPYWGFDLARDLELR